MKSGCRTNSKVQSFSCNLSICILKSPSYDNLLYAVQGRFFPEYQETAFKADFVGAENGLLYFWLHFWLKPPFRYSQQQPQVFTQICVQLGYFSCNKKKNDRGRMVVNIITKFFRFNEFYFKLKLFIIALDILLINSQSYLCTLSSILFEALIIFRTMAHAFLL